jgi:hypothetical protein
VYREYRHRAGASRWWQRRIGLEPEAAEPGRFTNLQRRMVADGWGAATNNALCRRWAMALSDSHTNNQWTISAV